MLMLLLHTRAAWGDSANPNRARLSNETCANCANMNFNFDNVILTETLLNTFNVFKIGARFKGMEQWNNNDLQVIEGLTGSSVGNSSSALTHHCCQGRSTSTLRGRDNLTHKQWNDNQQ